MNIYILQKDTPTSKAGTRFIPDIMGNYESEDDRGIVWLKRTVESSPTWFRKETEDYNDYWRKQFALSEAKCIRLERELENQRMWTEVYQHQSDHYRLMALDNLKYDVRQL